jgi:hypothetical protein
VIIAKPFVFVHVPKTGGSWVRDLVRDCAPPDWVVRVISTRHEPWRALTQAERARPCFWCVRNPWDWHVSNYHFWTGHYRAHTGGYLQPRGQWSPLERWWANLTERGLGFGEALPLAIADRQTQTGHVASLCRDEAGELRGQFLRFEGLRQNVAGYLRGLGLRLPARMVQALRDRPPRQTSEHRPFRSYYTPELAALVSQAEEQLLAPPFSYPWDAP